MKEISEKEDGLYKIMHLKFIRKLATSILMIVATFSIAGCVNTAQTSDTTASGNYPQYEKWWK